MNFTKDNFIIMPTSIGWSQGKSEQSSSSGTWSYSYDSIMGKLYIGASYGVPCSTGIHGICYTNGNKVYLFLS